MRSGVATFLKIVRWFLMTMGVLFLLLLAAAAYLWFADPLHLKPLLFGHPAPAPSAQRQPAANPSAAPSANGGTGSVPSYLSPQQARALQKVGVNPSTLPQNLTPQQQQCMIDAVGEKRAAEIQAGATPTPTEVYKASQCLK